MLNAPRPNMSSDLSIAEPSQWTGPAKTSANSDPQPRVSPGIPSEFDKGCRSNAVPKHQRASALLARRPHLTRTQQGDIVTDTNKDIREIAFIDPAVGYIETLIAGLRPEVHAVRLHTAAPAAAQIARALASRYGFEAIHVIAHGASGEVSFAAGALSLDSISRHRGSLAAIGRALNEDGELLLWSCGTGQGGDGAEFVDALEGACGAPVAAATGLVGAAARSASWTLDRLAGATMALSPLTKAGVASYPGVLDTSSTTVINLNVLDTSKTNDTSGVEYVSFSEVASALFPTTNAQQTLTIDSCFWQNDLQLTFYASGQWYTIWGTTDAGVHHIHIGISTDAYGNGTSELVKPLYSPYNASLGSSNGFVSWALSQTTTSGALSGTALLTTRGDRGRLR